MYPESESHDERLEVEGLGTLGRMGYTDIPNITRRVKTTLGPRCFLESLETPKGPLSEVLNVLKMCFLFLWD